MLSLPFHNSAGEDIGLWGGAVVGFGGSGGGGCGCADGGLGMDEWMGGWMADGLIVRVYFFIFWV